MPPLRPDPTLDELATTDPRHAATRALGVACVGWIGQLTVDAPAGYFGAADELTEFGFVYGACSLALGCFSALGYALGKAWARWCLVLLVIGSLAVFVPPLGQDPVICLVVIISMMGAAGQALFETGASSTTLRLQRFSDELEEPIDVWLHRWRPSLEHALVISIGCTTAVIGFGLTELALGPITCLVLDAIVVALLTPLLWDWLKRSLPLRLFLAGAVLSLVAVGSSPRALVGLLGVYQALVLVTLVRTGPIGTDLLRQFLARPALLLAVSFAGMCVLGAVVLSFPVASTGPQISLIDALFTATSAVCVTGLVVLDTPTAFSPFGQVLILALIQAGGLGIMVLSTFATILVGGRIGLRGEQALGEVLEMSSPGHAYRLARFIVLATFCIEGIGALFLAVSFRAHGFTWPEALWRGLFHAVSAFCNAGFALQSDSLVMFQEDPATLFVFSLLVIGGGIGFVVLAWAWERLTGRSRQRATIHVRVVLWVSAALLLFGFVEYLLVEWNHSLGGLRPADKVANAWFQGVTPRTAGFNSIDLMEMHEATVLVFMVLMFIGASPGGTGGGIKTTTFAILLATLPAVARGDVAIAVFRREIPPLVVLRACAIGFLATSFAISVTFCLVLTQPHDPLRLCFEAISALATVGLTLNVSMELDVVGKLLLVATMFVGRIGPVSLALLLARRGARRVSYPTSRMMVG